MAENVLVIAVHPDDETLGCGGTLLRHLKAGDKTNWLIATEMSKERSYTESQITRREEQINQVAALYGFASVTRLGFDAGYVDALPMAEVVGKIGDVIDRIHPSIVYMPYLFDAHSDHRFIFQSAFAATKSFRYPFIKKVLMMETQSETDFAVASNAQTFSPNYFVNISDQLRSKIAIADVYLEEFGEHPFPRSARNIEALATVRGAMVGFEFAEAFQLLKEICD